MRRMLLLLPGVLMACEPPPQRMTLEERAMNSCINMGIGALHPAYPACVTRMLQTYVQTESADLASRRAAAAAMYRPVQLAPVTVQQQPPSIFGNVTPVVVPPMYPR